MMGQNIEKPRAYARAKLWLALLSGAIELAAAVGFLVSRASEALAGWLAGHVPHAAIVAAYVVVTVIGLQILSLPLGWWGRRVEIRFGLNRQGLAGWLLDECKSLALGLVLGVLGAEVLYALLRATPAHWWWWAWGVFTAITVVLAQLGPVLLLPLFFKLRQMSETEEPDASMVRRLQATYARLRAENPKLPRLHGIFEWKLGEKSAKANAALTGLGPTRRVIISDTLLEGAAPEEIEAVFVHELGHHVHGDIWRGIAFQSALTLLGFWLADVALRALSPALGLRGIADIAGLPLVVIVFGVLGLLLMPASNAFVRSSPACADWRRRTWPRSIPRAGRSGCFTPTPQSPPASAAASGGSRRRTLRSAADKKLHSQALPAICNTSAGVKPLTSCSRAYSSNSEHPKMPGSSLLTDTCNPASKNARTGWRRPASHTPVFRFDI